MAERHRNIFCYYRGPTKHGDKSEKEKTLENNVTKALLNTIDLCPNLGIAFINWINKEKLLKNYCFHLNQTIINEWRILEGPKQEEIEDKNITKIMLGIKKYNGVDFQGKPRKSRMVDGTIVGQDWIIAIESKLGGMDMLQFQDEKKMINADKELQTDWQEIYNFFADQAKGQCDPVEKLFIEQFTEHLKEIGQLPFSGFESKHFDLFTKGKSKIQENERLELRSLINNLGGDLYDYKYGGQNVGNLFKGWDWVKGLNKKNDMDRADLKFYLSSRKMPNNQCYLDIMIDQNNLEVFACVKTKKLLSKLLHKLSHHGDNLLKILHNPALNGYVIQLWGDDDKNYLKGKLPNVAANKITKSDLGQLANVLKGNIQQKYLSFGLTKTFKKNKIIGTKNQLKMIAKTMLVLHPFIQFIEN